MKEKTFFDNGPKLEEQKSKLEFLELSILNLIQKIVFDALQILIRWLSTDCVRCDQTNELCRNPAMKNCRNARNVNKILHESVKLLALAS